MLINVKSFVKPVFLLLWLQGIKSETHRERKKKHTDKKWQNV